MSVNINTNYGSYAANYTNTASSKKSDETKNDKSVKESGVKTSTVELKTSTPGVTKTEQIKTGFTNVNDYSKYLQEKYSYMNTGTVSMEGVPTTVTVSSAFLKECMDDPEKAKELEENLAAIPDCAKMAVNDSLGNLTSLSYQIDANGNMTCTSSGSSVTVNIEKRARQIASAQTPSEVRMVLSLLNKDLADCKNGVSSGACDEAEVAKVQALLKKAQAKMSMVSSDSDAESDGSFFINMLM